MVHPIRNVRGYLSASRKHSNAIKLGVLLVAVSATGILTIHQVLLPALTGHTGFKTVLLAIALFFFPLQGLVLPYYIGRQRSHLRSLCMTFLFVFALGGYLVFLFDWWRLLGEYISLLGFIISNELEGIPEVGDLVRQVFLPHVFTALLRDILLGAYLQSALWESLRQQQVRKARTQAETEPAMPAEVAEEGAC